MLCMPGSARGGEEAPVRAIGFGVAQFWGSKAQGKLTHLSNGEYMEKWLSSQAKSYHTQLLPLLPDK